MMDDPLVGIWGRVEGSDPKYRWAFDGWGQAYYDNNQRGTWALVSEGVYLFTFPTCTYDASLDPEGFLTVQWRGQPWQRCHRMGSPVKERLDWELADSLRGFVRKEHPYLK